MIELIGVKVLDVIKQIQQAIVYIEDRLLEPFNLQELSDYVGLSPYHLDQMILQMILVIFTAYHLFKLLLKKMNYKFKSDYISNYQLLREHPIHTD